jgi:sugar phosphate isomerase/epimerase
VTGTAVGCACGDGVIDWRRVIEIIRRAPRDIVMSVECGSIDEAARSVKHLRSLL